MRSQILFLNLTLWLLWEAAPPAGAQGIDPVLAARFQLTLDSMRSCTIFYTDEETREYFRGRIR
jgi:hypothetical protein